MQTASGSWDEINGPVQLQLQVIADTPVVTVTFNGTDTLYISITF